MKTPSYYGLFRDNPAEIVDTCACRIDPILIRAKAYEKLKAYVKYASGEISGVGIVSSEEGRKIWIQDVYLIPQDAGVSHTIIDPVGLAKWVQEQASEGLDLKQVQMWWHSHGEFPPFWSATDKQTIDGFLRFTKWLISLVTNRENKCLTRIDVREPRITVIIPRIEIGETLTPEEEEEIRREVAEKVRPKRFWEYYYPFFSRDREEWYND
ncbi:MAG: hypothetical protein QW156_04185 [Candidatus Aenigmatarchaeota archaeon]